MVQSVIHDFLSLDGRVSLFWIFDFWSFSFSLVSHSPYKLVSFLEHRSSGEETNRFSVYSDLEQLIQHPTCAADQYSQTPQTLD